MVTLFCLYFYDEFLYSLRIHFLSVLDSPLFLHWTFNFWNSNTNSPHALKIWDMISYQRLNEVLKYYFLKC